MDRRDFSKKQLVLSTELDSAFDGVDEWAKAALQEFGGFGIVSGLVPSQHAPSADFSIDITAGVAYDADGERAPLAALATLSTDEDYLGASTEVLTSGNSRWMTVFAVFVRDESDQRIDGDGNTVFFVQNASIEFRLVQGSEAVTPTRPTAAADELVICDILREFGDTRTVDADLDLTRRSEFVQPAGSLLIRHREEALSTAANQGGLYVDGVDGHLKFREERDGTVTDLLSGGGSAAPTSTAFARVDPSSSDAVDDTDLTTAFLTIQAAVDAVAAGGTVLVYPKPDGSAYDEHVYIRKNLALVANGGSGAGLDGDAGIVSIEPSTLGSPITVTEATLASAQVLNARQVGLYDANYATDLVKDAGALPTRVDIRGFRLSCAVSTAPGISAIGVVTLGGFLSDGLYIEGCTVRRSYYFRNCGGVYASYCRFLNNNYIRNIDYAEWEYCFDNRIFAEYDATQPQPSFGKGDLRYRECFGLSQHAFEGALDVFMYNCTLGGFSMAYSGTGSAPDLQTRGCSSFGAISVGDGAQWVDYQSSHYGPSVFLAGAYLSACTLRGTRLSAVPTDTGSRVSYFEDGGTLTLSSALTSTRASEILGITEKASPVDADLVIIEDSADSYNKKRVQLVNLPGSGGGGTLAQTLALGNSTGANDIVLASGQKVVGEDGTDGGYATVQGGYASGGANYGGDAQLIGGDGVYGGGSAFLSGGDGASYGGWIYLIPGSGADADTSGQVWLAGSLALARITNVPVTYAAGGALFVDNADGHLKYREPSAGTVTDLLSAGSDSDAIHDNVAAEISALTEKASPVDADLVVIEDSADSYNKKKVQIVNLGGGGGSLAPSWGRMGLTTSVSFGVSVTAQVWYEWDYFNLSYVAGGNYVTFVGGTGDHLVIGSDGAGLYSAHAGFVFSSNIPANNLDFQLLVNGSPVGVCIGRVNDASSQDRGASIHDYISLAVGDTVGLGIYKRDTGTNVYVALVGGVAIHRISS